MDGAGEGRALGQDGESVAQVSHVVLGLDFVGVKRFVALNRTIEKQPLSLSLQLEPALLRVDLKRDITATYLENLSGIVLGDLVCGRAFIYNI